MTCRFAAVLVFLVAALAASRPAHAVQLDDAAAAAALVQAGATVLDTRGTIDFLRGHLPGAVNVEWRIGVVGGLRSGTLGPPDAVAAAFGALGVSRDRPVLVVGAWAAGWGEEGRIAWDLEYLGHADVHVLRGGIERWDGALERGLSRPRPAVFVAAVRSELRADRAAVKRAALVIDVREPEEYAGSNAYFAAYGGHVPGAVNFPWRRVVAGASPPREPAVVYCTGGVRSAFVWMLLSAQGQAVANYDGSWWDWAANEPAPV
jgi:3-mercaptopyruvate sulfurtransferase SseA